MVAGLVLLCNIISYSFSNDDEVGGAEPSGTVAYSNVGIRLNNSRNSLDLAIQGFETGKYFSAIITPRPGMVLEERKHFVKIVSPPNSRYYNKLFRIINVLEPNVHPGDPRRYFVLNLERSDMNHAENYQ